MKKWGDSRRQTVESPDLWMWMVVLIVQSLPYLAAVILALISAFPRLPAWTDKSA